MMSGYHSCGYKAAVAAVAVLIACSTALSADFSNRGISDVVRAADALLRKGDYASAIPALKEIVDRTESAASSNAEMRRTLQESRFQLGRAYFQIGNGQDGMKYLEDYMETKPRNDERMALRMMARGYLETEQWEKAEEFSSRLLSADLLEPEDRLYGSLLYGQALFHLEKWDESIEPLMYAVNNSREEDVRRTAQLFAASAMVEGKQWSELFVLLRTIMSTDAKYDITLNITLMQGGKMLFEGALEKDEEEGRGDLLNALFLYRMVLSREKLIEFANERINTFEAEMEKMARAGGPQANASAVQEEIDKLRESVKFLKELPPYEEEVNFRIGQIYAEVKRYWESYVLFDALYNKDRNSEIGEASVLQSVQVLYDMKDKQLAEERVLRYLNEKPAGLYAASLLSRLMRDNISKENYARVVQMRPYVNQVEEASAEGDDLVVAELRYLLAFGYFFNKEYSSSADQFGIVIDRYGETQLREISVYFRGMAYLMQGDYANAMADFITYQEEGDTADYYSSAMFREAICLFGLEKIPEAEAALTKFIETFPEDDLVSEAYSIRGDIEAAKESSDDYSTPDIDESDPYTLDRALKDYRMAIDKHSTPQQASYAVFQAAKVYQLEGKWQEIIDIVNYYIDLLDDRADVSQAMFWIGQSKIQMEQVDEAVTAYLDAIERFGNDPQQYGVDKIILELVNNIAMNYLSEAQQEALMMKISRKLDAAGEDDEVLKLRLRFAGAALKGGDALTALGDELVASGQALTSTTPISLSLMSDAAIKAGDGELMGRIYDYFLEHFEESQELWNAYRAKMNQQLAEKDYPGALLTISSVQDLYGAESFMGWAQLAKGNILYEMGDYEEAEKAYNTIMGVPQWRGRLYAQAYYGMARGRLATRDYETAHAYFQRLYLLFKAYDNGKWAAEGYLGAADCLVKLGRNEDAVKTLDEMLRDSNFNTLPQAETARELKKKYGGA
jgi:tetratricopeptide (TPR) repeat protein